LKLKDEMERSDEDATEVVHASANAIIEEDATVSEEIISDRERRYNDLRFGLFLALVLCVNIMGKQFEKYFFCL